MKHTFYVRCPEKGLEHHCDVAGGFPPSLEELQAHFRERLPCTPTGVQVFVGIEGRESSMMVDTQCDIEYLNDLLLRSLLEKGRETFKRREGPS